MKKPCTPAVLLVGLLAALTAGACSSTDGPSQSPLNLVKSPTKSGDVQTGPAGQTLPNPLRVLVTRDGEPQSAVSVTWSTPSGGSLDPETAKTDANGIGATTWTLGSTAGMQTVQAAVTGATNSPQTFSATATSGNGGGPSPEVTIQVLSVGGNRFDPAEVSIITGQTVIWEWGAGATGHNIVPDNGTIPAGSGALADAPHTYSFTFNTAGTYHYHCKAHGDVGGVGMAGTIIVLAQP